MTWAQSDVRPATGPSTGDRYRRAVAAWEAWSAPARAMNGPATPNAPTTQAMADAMRRMRDGLPVLFDALDPTEFAVSPKDRHALPGVFEAMATFVDRHGVAATTQEAKMAGVVPGMEDARKLFDVGQLLADRAAAEADAAAPKGNRPPAIGPTRTLDLADGRIVTVPGPVLFPEWLRTSPAFKRWETVGDVRTFTTTDDSGNTYVVPMNGRVKLADGRTVPFAAPILLFRPDHTLAAVADYVTGELRGWKTMDATGKRIVWWAEIDGTPARLWRVRQFAPDDTQTVWTWTDHSTAWNEGRLDPIGEFDPALNPPKQGK